MITDKDIRKGARFILDGQPYEVLEAMPLKKAQRRVVIQSRIKNLLSGEVLERNFHQGDVFDEAEIEKFDAKLVYSYKGKFVFCDSQNASKRFEMTENQVGKGVKFLKPSQIVQANVFEEKIVSVTLPIKVELKVTQAPPGVKGDSAQGATKSVVLETGAEINVPLFINEGDIIEINTDTEQYTRRIGK